MPKNPSIYKSRMEAKDAFIRDVQRHRNLIREAFNKYGKALCDAIGADVDEVESRVIKHDVSKYQEEVEVEGLMAYYYRYPQDGLGLDSMRRKYLFDRAMLNHYHVNSCHPEYWIQYRPNKSNDPCDPEANEPKMFALDMDNESIVEMVLDWVAIGMEPDFDRADIYWANNRNKKMMTRNTVAKTDKLMDLFHKMAEAEEHDPET